ncbi:MAG TPA: sigma-54 dependent transcriptional regulator [Candidatus Brocadiia bacterium]|nr:sigma-54 dependent transcriptional regulator [Candidatus Brocadiia bacterium]
MTDNDKTEILKVLIADDEPASRFGMKRALQKQGYLILEAADGREAVRICREQRPEIALLDLNMPKLAGMKALEKIVAADNPPLVIVVTAYGSEKVAVDAMKNGAYDYVAKPYEVDELRMAVARAAETVMLRREAEKLRSEVRQGVGFGRMVGQSAAIRQVFSAIEKVAAADVAVLITGESGTGKELAAREIHARSRRSAGPLIVVNSAAMPETLVESELFGCEKGAFTGAEEQRQGKFELADGGTLFLDEIGDMSAGTQAKILRILEEQTFERLGGGASIRVNVRLISATNRDIRKLIETERFREDLYFRLKVVEIVLPPLRERPEDIPLLAEHFLGVMVRKHGRGPRAITPDAVKALVAQPWPGNIRQLANAIENCVVMASGDEVRLEDLPEDIVKPGAADASAIAVRHDLPFREAKQEFVRSFERTYLLRKLEENDGNISRTAEALGMQRQNLQQKLRDLGTR